MKNQAPVKSFFIRRYKENSFLDDQDLLVQEEPLEIRLRYGKPDFRSEKKVSVTMRTPGNDFELVTGFLFTEGIIHRPEDVTGIRYCLQVQSELEEGNVVILELGTNVEWDAALLERNFFMASSCGVCGKASIENIILKCKPISTGQKFKADFLAGLGNHVSSEQKIFKATGGLHAAALVSPSGEILKIREDVGRHNAVDKAIGAQWMENPDLFSSSVLFVSGRAGFELVQKAAMAGIPAMVSVGAPSALAVEIARESGITLAGFANKGNMNVYHDEDRIVW